MQQRSTKRAATIQNGVGHHFSDSSFCAKKEHVTRNKAQIRNAAKEGTDMHMCIH